MRFTTYSKYKGKWLDALNLESLLEHLSDFLMDGGFAGGPHYHPYWGWSGDEDTNKLTEAFNRIGRFRRWVARGIASGFNYIKKKSLGRYNDERRIRINRR